MNSVDELMGHVEAFGQACTLRGILEAKGKPTISADRDISESADAIRSLVTNGRALPHPGSPEASAMMDSVLAEYNWPANSKNAARAGWEAANRWMTKQG